MKMLSLSAIGKDRTGIVSSISEILFKLGCNIEDSTMTLLSGQFAVNVACLSEKFGCFQNKEKFKFFNEKVGIILFRDGSR